MLIPGYNKMRGPTEISVHMYVVDHGDKREVQLVGPYGLGDKGSTDRLLQSIASRFSDWRWRHAAVWPPSTHSASG